MAFLGGGFALVLSFFSRRFRVRENELVEKIAQILPGLNCGACGYSTCRTLAEKIAQGEESKNKCKIGGEKVLGALVNLLGGEKEKREKKFAVLRCGASSKERKKGAHYRGVRTCRAAHPLGGETKCPFGCLGFGDCAEACPLGAIRMEEGLPRIDYSLCTGCGICLRVCPRNLFTLESLEEKNYFVLCSSPERGKRVKEVCEKGCTGCGICEKVCPVSAPRIENNLSRIDQGICERRGICAEKCPTGAIGLIERGKI